MADAGEHSSGCGQFRVLLQSLRGSRPQIQHPSIRRSPLPPSCRSRTRMVEHGVYGAYAHNRDGLRTPYLSEDRWRAVGAARLLDAGRQQEPCGGGQCRISHPCARSEGDAGDRPEAGGGFPSQRKPTGRFGWAIWTRSAGRGNTSHPASGRELHKGSRRPWLFPACLDQVDQAIHDALLGATRL